MKDLITLSFFAGTIAYAVRVITNHVLEYTGLTPFLYRVVAADLFLPLSKAQSFYGFWLGFFADWIGVIWVALVIAYALKTTGKNHYLIKGGVIGASSWLFVFGFLMQAGLLGVKKPDDYASGLTALFLDIAMGMIVATALVYLSKVDRLNKMK